MTFELVLRLRLERASPVADRAESEANIFELLLRASADKKRAEIVEGRLKEEREKERLALGGGPAGGEAGKGSAKGGGGGEAVTLEGKRRRRRMNYTE
jgi:hypothetical protein